MQLAEILVPSCVVVPLKASQKDQAIAELVTLLADAGQITSPEIALQAVMDRESIRSTGIGQGFAIPHGKCNAAKKLVMAIGKLATPIEFDSIDQQPVGLIALLVSPVDQTGPHIQALAKISRVIANNDIRQKIWDSQSSQQLYGLLVDSKD